MKLRTLFATTALLVCLPFAAQAAEKGDVVQTDNLGMNMVSWNLTKGTHTTVQDQQALSEFVGASYYLTDKVRIGGNLQFTEVLAPEPKTSRFSKFAILPQIGYNFWGPMFAAAIFTLAPRTAGGDNLVLGVQGLVGAGFEVAKGVRVNGALEIPWDFYNATGKNQQVLGITPLVGMSFKLN